ncbi:hypothetical protein KR093_002276 [Drosophila rubida]|uniref:Transcription factor Ouib n=1 Tax=Drosophila rubida TaxID=30044 RepID=A0AAD4JSJ8_9MUSC|nr:hypothetical protein KR093_002276 [Drosophila rubida]
MPLQCRTCGEPIFNANPRNLFMHDNADIRQNIEVITGIKLSPDARLPSHICSCCYLDLDHSMAFRSRCLEASAFFEAELKHLDPLDARSDGKTNKKRGRPRVDEIRQKSKLNPLSPRVYIKRCPDIVKNDRKKARPKPEADIDSKPKYDIAVAIRENMNKSRKKKPIVTPLEKKYICHVCGWTFSDLSNMKDHAVRHTGIKKFHCQECSSKFFTRPQLMLHIRVHHKGEMPFVCKYCGMGFRNSPSRCRHELKFHANQLPFACNLCPKTFVSKISLNKHKQAHETGEVIYRCETCNKTFKGPTFLKNHYLTGRHRRRLQQAHENATASDGDAKVYSDDEIDFDFADSIIEEVDE